MSRNSSIGAVVLVLALIATRFFWKDIVELVAPSKPAPVAFTTPGTRIQWAPKTGQGASNTKISVPGAGGATGKQHIDFGNVQRVDATNRGKYIPLGQLAEGPTGRLVFSYEASQDPNDYTAVTFLVNRPLFQSLSNQVYTYLPLEQDLPVVVARCGKINAFWAPEERIIVLCTELIDFFYQVFRRLPQVEQRAAVDGALLFTLTHEVGHAAEDLLGLKLVGRAEDNADQFAVLLLLAMGEPGLRAIKAASLWFSAQGAMQFATGQIPYWDEHTLDAQRYVNLLCYLYGKDPFRHVFLVGDGHLPPERARRCGDEYQRMRAGWKEQLDLRLKRPLP